MQDNWPRPTTIGRRRRPSASFLRCRWSGKLPLDQRADVYVEAARAAINVNDFDTAVSRFLKAADVKAADPEQADELLGALIAAKRTTLAIQILRQLDRSDRVLRRIVDVYEMAQEPEKAVPEMEELHRRHPDDAQLVRRLAELAVVRRDFAAGLGYYRALWKMEPGDGNVRKKVAENAAPAGAEGRRRQAFRSGSHALRRIVPHGSARGSVEAGIRRTAGFGRTIRRGDQGAGAAQGSEIAA